MRSNSFLARCSSSSVLLMRLLSLKIEREDNKEHDNSKTQVFWAEHFGWNPFILPQQNASVLMTAEANLFELLHLVFQTVDSVHQTPAATERAFTVRLNVQLQRTTWLSLHRCMLAFGHTIIFHLHNCSQSIQTFHVFLWVVNPGLTMAMSSLYKLNQRCRVHTLKEENTLVFTEDPFVALIVPVLWLVAFSILTWNVDVIHILFLQWLTSLHRLSYSWPCKCGHWGSLSSPFLHHRLSVALGLLDDDLLLLWKEHLYILPAGAWWDRDYGVKDCVQSPLTFTTQATDWETIIKYLNK